MKRREFIAALGSALALRPLAALAQGERVRSIGVLMPFPSDNPEAQARMRAFREELRKRGWAAGLASTPSHLIYYTNEHYNR